MYVHIYIHTYIHTYIHRYIHTYIHVFHTCVFVCKATPIYLLVLQAPEAGNEPFWNNKKS